MQVTYLNPDLPPPLAQIYFPEGFYFPEGASFTDNENEIIFIDSFNISNHKTKDLNKNLKSFEFNSALFIHNENQKSR